MCNHIIGLLDKGDSVKLVDLCNLKSYVKQQAQFFAWLRDMKSHLWDGRTEAYTMNDYCDLRKTTDLTRFKFCPICGEKINWKEFKEEDK